MSATVVARRDVLGRVTRWAVTEERFRARYSKHERGYDSPCWLWDVPHPKSGYGTIWDSAQQKNVLAHRWSYEHFVGPIPLGLQVDHLCRNRSCVNPAHLEPVTPDENVRRGYWVIRTHCQNGHEFTPENTYSSARGYRRCRACVLPSNAGRSL